MNTQPAYRGLIRTTKHADAFRGIVTNVDGMILATTLAIFTNVIDLVYATYSYAGVGRLCVNAELSACFDAENGEI